MCIITLDIDITCLLTFVVGFLCLFCDAVLMYVIGNPTTSERNLYFLCILKQNKKPYYTLIIYIIIFIRTIDYGKLVKAMYCIVNYSLKTTLLLHIL